MVLAVRHGGLNLSDDEKLGRWSNGFRAVGAELARRTHRPSREFVYWVHFALCVVILGGLGFWIELIQQNHLLPVQRSWNNAYTALVTFFPAVIGSSCVQMMFESGDRRMHAFSLVTCFGAFIIGAALISAARPVDVFTWFAAIVMSLVSLWVWWIANADNTKLHDEPSDDAPLGGDPTAPLSGDFGGVRV